MKQFSLPIQLGQDVLNFLSIRPCGEVFEMVTGLKTLKATTEAPNPEALIITEALVQQIYAYLTTQEFRHVYTLIPALSSLQQISTESLPDAVTAS
jgi:hypothetical protein